MNSDIYSSVLTQKKMIVLVLDNGGFAVINKLQNNTGQGKLSTTSSPTRPTASDAKCAVDFESPRARDGRETLKQARNPVRFGGRVQARARRRTRPTVIVHARVDPYDGWTAEGHTWWEVGTPHVSDKPRVSTPPTPSKLKARGRANARVSEP